ncbi:MAG: adenylate kinase [Muribaculaceae bacterium]|nr:adenylate kinase [Muribaculaceae bacterium]MDE6855715.1 adenylate kinase [Muribaculaceae bacterium]
MLNLVLFGAPGSGKGTQSEKIIDRYGLHHISTGEVLRKQIKEGTELGKIADSYISKGHLIPDDLMIDILRQELKGLPKECKGVIFDGFPRTIPQAEELENLLAEIGSDLTGVVGLEVPEEELVARMLKRGKETGRADDNIDTILNRLKVYHNQTEPLKEHYQGKGAYMHIDGLGDVDSIFGSISDKIDERIKG